MLDDHPGLPHGSIELVALRAPRQLVEDRVAVLLQEARHSLHEHRRPEDVLAGDGAR
ncbi:MAG: hypothetical protein IPN17_38855 [Deltaproteobacteria bacterium]|nr:hypothetical protein [Deltaproteobacteria bacterium]